MRCSGLRRPLGLTTRVSFRRREPDARARQGHSHTQGESVEKASCTAEDLLRGRKGSFYSYSGKVKNPQSGCARIRGFQLRSIAKGGDVSRSGSPNLFLFCRGGRARRRARIACHGVGGSGGRGFRRRRAGFCGRCRKGDIRRRDRDFGRRGGRRGRFRLLRASRQTCGDNGGGENGAVFHVGTPEADPQRAEPGRLNLVATVGSPLTHSYKHPSFEDPE